MRILQLSKVIARYFTSRAHTFAVLRDCRGAAGQEYAILASLVSIAFIGAVTLLGDDVATSLANTSQVVVGSTPGSGGGAGESTSNGGNSNDNSASGREDSANDGGHTDNADAAGNGGSGASSDGGDQAATQFGSGADGQVDDGDASSGGSSGGDVADSGGSGRGGSGGVIGNASRVGVNCDSGHSNSRNDACDTDHGSGHSISGRNNGHRP